MTFGVLSALGMAVFGGLIGAWIFQKIKFPQVVGYIIIGLLIGEVGFGLIGAEDVKELKSINLFALGIIGFLVGGELKIEIFKKYAKQFTSILLFEGCLAFALVSGAIFTVIYCLTGNYAASMATGLIFGAIASATDPASTMDVLWEYRAAGAVTTGTIAVIALDDALAMTLYGISTGTAQLLMQDSSSGIFTSLLKVATELFGSILIGGVFAFLLLLFLRQIKQFERATALSIGVILLSIGVVNYLHMDIILCTMTIGFILVNFVPRRSEKIFTLMRNFAIPLYVLFFVLVGARLDITRMPLWLWGVSIIYIFGRNIGKIVGCYYGAKLAKAPDAVCKYMGMGLFTQGGVAIGLSIVAGEYLKGVKIHGDLELSDMIIYVVTATTLLLQLVGPPMVKLATKLAGENGKNITEEDLMEQLKVSDIVGKMPVTLNEGDSLNRAVEYFSNSEFTICIVKDSNEKVCGILSFDALKSVLTEHDTWCWLLVADVMQPVKEFVNTDQSLITAYNCMLDNHHDQLPVFSGAENNIPIGILGMRILKQKVQAKLLLIRGNV